MRAVLTESHVTVPQCHAHAHGLHANTSHIRYCGRPCAESELTHCRRGLWTEGSGDAREAVPAGGLGRAPLRIFESAASTCLPHRRSTLAAGDGRAPRGRWLARESGGRPMDPGLGGSRIGRERMSNENEEFRVALQASLRWCRLSRQLIGRLKVYSATLLHCR